MIKTLHDQLREVIAGQVEVHQELRTCQTFGRRAVLVARWKELVVLEGELLAALYHD